MHMLSHPFVLKPLMHFHVRNDQGDVMQFQYTFLASLNNIELHVGLHDVSTKIDAPLVLVNKGSILHL